MAKKGRIDRGKLAVAAWTQEKVIVSRGQPKVARNKMYRTMRAWLKKSWSDETSTLRRSRSVLTLAVYSFLGSAVFYSLEKSTKNYWQCLSFANSIFTTIGYGQMKPETNAGKVFTIFYAIVGVPITGMAASDLGLIMMYWLGKGWVWIRRFRKAINRIFCKRCTKRNANVVTIPSDDSVCEKGKEDSLPFSFAVATLLLWLLLSSFYFYLTQSNWTFFIAFYFLFISVSTIGLGDYTVHEDTPQTILDYAFIIAGLALFSLCVSLFVAKIESVDEVVAQSILNEYTQSLQSTYAFRSDDGRVEESESEQRRRIRRMIRKKAGCMKYFLGRKLEAKMLKEYQKRANMRLKMTQTVTRMRNVAVAARPSQCDAETMAGESCLARRSKRDRRHKWRRGKKEVRNGKRADHSMSNS